MGLEKRILSIVLGLLNFLTFYLKPRPGRITFISMTMETLKGDLAQVDALLKKEGKYDLQYDLIQIKKSLWGDFLYFLDLCRQLIEIKKSELVILNDNNYIISNFKPKGVKVLQIWHACGAIKKFGNQIKREYPISGYDAITCSSPYWKEVYAQAFDQDSQQVHVTGMPRIDLLMDKMLQQKNVEAFYQAHPECRNKRCILYAPTFRGNIVKGFEIASFDIGKVIDQLDEDMILLVKFHPLLKTEMIQHTRVIDCHQEDLYTLMSLSSCLISDYSSVILDYSLLKKPMIAYVDDLLHYQKTIGLNIDYINEFPGKVCTNETELVDALKNVAWDTSYETFSKKYMTYQDQHNTQRVVALIDRMMNTV